MFFGRGTTTSNRIAPAMVQDMLANREDFVLLDVRTHPEHVSGHIPGSTLLTLDELPSRTAKVLQDQNKPIVVYCHSGARSAQAARILGKMGYADVRDLGGIMFWPFQVTRGL